MTVAEAVPACDHTSVGAIIRNPQGRLLTFRRATFPPGIAGPAGHVDDHGGPDEAVIAEVHEEVGLTVTSCQLITSSVRPGACRRPGGQNGHTWWLYEVEAEGELAPSWRETRDTAWRSPADLRTLADRTIAYARGHKTEAEFTANPGIEPMWLRWFDLSGAIAVAAEDLSLVEHFLRVHRPPA